MASFKFNDFFLGILLFNVQGLDSRSLMYCNGIRLIRTNDPHKLHKQLICRNNSSVLTWLESFMDFFCLGMGNEQIMILLCFLYIKVQNIWCTQTYRACVCVSANVLVDCSLLCSTNEEHQLHVGSYVVYFRIADNLPFNVNYFILCLCYTWV